MSSDLKVKDKVRPKGKRDRSVNREILFVSADHVVYERSSPTGNYREEYYLPRSQFDNEFELVPDFFEEGVAYERFHYGPYAVDPVKQYFRPQYIRKNGDGTLVAIGTQSTEGVAGDWRLKGDRHFNDEGWRPVT